MAGGEESAGEDTRADVVVVGAGMGGMSAAAYAAQHGASVIVIEAAAEIGGSALLSGSSFWTADSSETLAREDPHGRRDLVDTLIADYPRVREWLQGQDLTFGEIYSTLPLYGFGSQGIRIDIVKAMHQWRRDVERAGGWIATSTEPVRLLRHSRGGIAGVEVRDREGIARISTSACILATGGFQGSAELLREYLGPASSSLLLRANGHSNGTGLRLAQAVGAALSGDMTAFYGHLVPYPLAERFAPGQYIPLAQLWSTRAVLVNQLGRRFADESRGYFWNGQLVSRLSPPRALLIGDQRVRAADGVGYRPGHMQLDRVQEAADAGGHVAVVESLGELDAAVAKWGYAGAAHAIDEFNNAMENDASMTSPARDRYRDPLGTPPYFAIEVQPAITFTEGGLSIDTNSRVLDSMGHPIPGLFAAGADVGGVFAGGYAGGLAMAAVFGVRAAASGVAAASIAGATEPGSG